MSRIKAVALGIVTVGILGVLLLPQVQKTSDDGVAGLTRARLKEIGVALHNYHETYGRLPPSVTYGRNGDPLHSWRVLLLPFLEQEGLYRQLRLDEPWDSPHNMPLLRETPRCYRTNQPGGMTHFQAFVGSGTAYERFSDDRPNAFLVVEATQPVPWAKPVDLTYDPIGPVPSLGTGHAKPVRFAGYDIGSNPGFVGCFADGSTCFIDARVPESTLRAFITDRPTECR